MPVPCVLSIKEEDVARYTTCVETSAVAVAGVIVVVKRLIFLLVGVKDVSVWRRFIDISEEPLLILKYLLQ